MLHPHYCCCHDQTELQDACCLPASGLGFRGYSKPLTLNPKPCALTCCSPPQLLPQFCQCLPGLRIASAKPYVVQGLWRIQCVPERDRTAIIVFTILGAALAAAVATMVYQLIMRNRHALGMPGQPGRQASTAWMHELGEGSKGCTVLRQQGRCGCWQPPFVRGMAGQGHDCRRCLSSRGMCCCWCPAQPAPR